MEIASAGCILSTSMPHGLGLPCHFTKLNRSTMTATTHTSSHQIEHEIKCKAQLSDCDSSAGGRRRRFFCAGEGPALGDFCCGDRSGRGLCRLPGSSANPAKHFHFFEMQVGEHWLRLRAWVCARPIACNGELGSFKNVSGQLVRPQQEQSKREYPYRSL